MRSKLRATPFRARRVPSPIFPPRVGALTTREIDDTTYLEQPTRSCVMEG
ncbi:MAG: hypothetical protein V1784_11060 [bacterium]